MSELSDRIPVFNQKISIPLLLPGFIFWQHLFVLTVWLAALGISSLTLSISCLLAVIAGMAITYNFFRLRRQYCGYLLFDWQSWNYHLPGVPGRSLHLVSYSVLFHGIIVLRFKDDTKLIQKHIEYVFTPKTLDLSTFQQLKILAQNKKLIV